VQWQLEVGHGKHTTPDGNIHLPQHVHCPDNFAKSLIHCIYSDIQEPHNDKYFLECTILSACNDNVDSINLKLLHDFSQEERSFRVLTLLTMRAQVKESNSCIPLSI
jgi:hypothetical protein